MLRRGQIAQRHLGVQADVVHFFGNAVMRASERTGDAMSEEDSENLGIRRLIESLFVRLIIDVVSVMVVAIHPDEFEICANACSWFLLVDFLFPHL
jgi:hypothetical protein